MRHAKLAEVTITAAQCTDEATLHAFLKEELDFPDYYGGNLSALADCLSSCGWPVLLTIDVAEDEIEPGMQAYLLRFVQVCARESFVNPNVSLILQHSKR